jgi:hypothetical protein
MDDRDWYTKLHSKIGKHYIAEEEEQKAIVNLGYLHYLQTHLVILSQLSTVYI